MTQNASPSQAAETIRMVEMVFPNTTNHYGTLFGGKVLDLMDRAAFVAATRFSHQTIVTVSTEHIDFLAPVKSGHLIELMARVVYTGRTSLTVKVDLFSENPVLRHRAHASTGYFHMVAVDAHGKPEQVPALLVDDEAGRVEWKRVEELRAARKSTG